MSGDMSAPPNNDCLSERQLSLPGFRTDSEFRDRSHKSFCCVIYLKERKKKNLSLHNWPRKGNSEEMESSVICFTDIPDKPGTTAHLNNHSMDPSNWVETCLSNLSPSQNPARGAKKGLQSVHTWELIWNEEAGKGIEQNRLRQSWILSLLLHRSIWFPPTGKICFSSGCHTNACMKGRDFAIKCIARVCICD